MGIWLKRIGIVVGALVVLILLMGAMLPREFSVVRRITIAAPPQAVNVFVGDLKRWDEWTPWQEADPTVHITLGPVTSGVGASQSWTGAEGGGHLQFTQYDELRGIGYDVTFDESMGACQASIHYLRVPEGTTVTWRLNGAMPTPVLGGLLAAMMDPMAGPMLATGLIKLKHVVEASDPGLSSGSGHG